MRIIYMCLCDRAHAPTDDTTAASHDAIDSASFRARSRRATVEDSTWASPPTASKVRRHHFGARLVGEGNPCTHARMHDDTDWVDAFDGVHPLYDIGSGYGVRVRTWNPPYQKRHDETSIDHPSTPVSLSLFHTHTHTLKYRRTSWRRLRGGPTPRSWRWTWSRPTWTTSGAYQPSCFFSYFASVCACVLSLNQYRIYPPLFRYRRARAPPAAVASGQLQFKVTVHTPMISNSPSFLPITTPTNPPHKIQLGELPDGVSFLPPASSSGVLLAQVVHFLSGEGVGRTFEHAHR